MQRYLHMVARHLWLNKIEQAWQHKTVVWLSGVRRAGKTYLSQSIPEVKYFDCELPSVRQMLRDPEGFMSSFVDEKIVLDEVHRLDNPSEALKIAADHYPKLKILATGSSTLGASTKFKDTLTGRKAEIWLTPIVTKDLKDFGLNDVKHRLQKGGLPPFFLAKNIPEADFQEWMDAFWAKDIEELFRLERRQSFQRFTELLTIQSGGIFEASRFAGPCEVSRTTISNYLSVLEATYVAHVIRPFSSRRGTEIITAPKVYAFDTGFISYYRGWHKLRPEDLGHLWEHFVLNELHAFLQSRRINYWRDKRGHEIDFVLPNRTQHPLAIECKWKADDFLPINVSAFRKQYAQGKNLVVCSDVEHAFIRNYHSVAVKFVSLKGLIDECSQLHIPDSSGTWD